MKRHWLGWMALLLVFVTGQVMADDPPPPPSWKIKNGSGVGLTGTYGSAPDACMAWYQHWNGVFGTFATVTYKAPEVDTDSNAPTTTTEDCHTIVVLGDSQLVESSLLTRSPSCKDDETFDPNQDVCVANNQDDGKNTGDAGDCDGGVGVLIDNKVACDGTPMATDPINTATGNKFQQDTDFQGAPWLTFRRFYNSAPVLASRLGPRWRHSFDRSLYIQLTGANGGTTPNIRLYRPDGSSEPFQKVAGVWTADADMADVLTEQDDASGNPTGYTVFIAPRREYEQYSATGVLQTITNAAGQTTTLTYSDASTPTTIAPKAGLLITATAPNGRTLQFSYSTGSGLAHVTLPDGGVLNYGYDPAFGNLTSVQYPDGKKLQYVYNEASLNGGSTSSSMLTGVIDETATRYASTGYTSSGQATSFTLPGGANASAVTYGTNGASTLTTPLGTALTLQAQSDGFGTVKLSSTSAPCGTQCTQPWQAQTYDANGYPASVTDWNGNVTKMTFDNNGLLDVNVEAFGTVNQRTTTTTWNVTLRKPLTRIVQDQAGTTLFQEGWVYNTGGQVLADCRMDPAVSTAASYTCATTGTPPTGVRRDLYTYCSAVDGVQCPIVGLALSHTDPNGHTAAYAYYMTASAVNCGTPGAACYQPGDLKSVTDALGHVATNNSYDGAGRVTRVTDANGIITDSTYTPRGWLATSIVRANADGSASAGDATTTTSYTAWGAVASITDPDGVVLSYTYDAAHRLTDLTDAAGNHIHYTLDASGNKTKEETFDANGTSRRTLSRTFNALGQLTQVTDGLGHATVNANYTDSYDANGNLTHTADAQGVQRQQGFDQLNRLVTAIDNYNGTDTATQNTTMGLAYDALNQLTTVTDPSNLVTHYTYDGLGNRTALQSPDTGASGDTYDAAGNRLMHTDARGITSTTTYDVVNRPMTTAYPDASSNVTYYYDEANTVTGCASSSPIGRLTRIIESTVTTVYCYDARGNVLQKRQITSAATDTINYTYTAADRLSTLTEPDGTVVTDTYNTLGQLTTVQVAPLGGATQTAVSGATYVPFGPVASYTLGNGQTVTRTYDANYNVSDITSPALNLHFARDAMGHINALGNAPGANPAVETYSYDPLYRLTAVMDSGAAVESYTYNRTGDRLSKTSAGGMATGTYGYQMGTHRLTSVGNAARSYDSNGNTIGGASNGQTYGFGYDNRNRLSLVQANQVTVATYTYNAMGERVVEVVTSPSAFSEHFAYNEWNQIIGEYGTSSRDYIWLGNLPVAVVDAGTSVTINYVHADVLGTPRSIVDSSGTLQWQWPYVGNPFGEKPPISTNGYVFNLRFPGQYYDIASGTIQNGFRDYCPECGRYLQSDPTGLNGGLSTYMYVNGLPLNRSDVLGLQNLSIPVVEVDPYEAMREAARIDPESAERANDERIDREINAVRGQGAVPSLRIPLTQFVGESAVCKAGDLEPVSAVSPIIDPADVAGKKIAEIEAVALKAGLLPRGSNPIAGAGSYIDPVTGAQRVLIHAEDDPPHAHVNNSTGQRLDVNGNVVPRDSPEAHLPIGK